MTAPRLASWLEPRRRALALLCSVALHVVVIAGLSQVQWRHRVALPAPETIIVWAGEWPAPQVRREPLPEPPTAAELTEPTSASSAADDTTAPTTETQATPSERPVTVAEADRPAHEGADETAEDTSPDIDWQAAREHVVAALVTELTRESKFSIAADREDEALLPEPGAIFDAPPRPRRALLSPGQARTRAGRWARELCNALTGGFGFFGVAVCADTEAPVTYFAHLKPEYMKKRPVCEEPDALDPLMAEISRRNGIPTTKCRLLYAEEIDALDFQVADTSQAQARQ